VDGSTFWAVAALLGMVVAAVASFVPFVPGPALVWAVGMIYAFATGFDVVGVGAVVWMTIFMLLGSTADWWTRLFGLGGEGNLSCGTYAVSGAGAIAGTFLIPVPLFGTLIGAALAVAALVFYQTDDAVAARKAARGIASAWIASFFVELVVAISIIYLFFRSLTSAGMLPGT